MVEYRLKKKQFLNNKLTIEFRFQIIVAYIYLNIRFTVSY